ncbi:MAG: hypothetical protein IKU37_01285 [Candidatus Gastranaerophilales bacterium]|nr:hypothetical protein [Candidatus Gastranaerophilales bacterium]
MKKNEIIELNGQEYTLELNRDSFIQIDRLCNIQKSMDIVQRGLYEYMDEEELDDNFDINSLSIDEEKMEQEVELKEKTLHKIIERAFLIWLNPNHHLKPSEVKEILKPYFEDEDKADFLARKYMEYLQECIEIRESYNEEQKNLKAQANKK